MVLEQGLGELGELADLLDVVLHDVVHAHLGQVERLGELVLGLRQEENDEDEDEVEEEEVEDEAGGGGVQDKEIKQVRRAGHFRYFWIFLIIKNYFCIF